MGAELDLAEDEAAAVFSARKIRTRLRADGLKPVTAFRDTLAWGSPTAHREAETAKAHRG